MTVIDIEQHRKWCKDSSNEDGGIYCIHGIVCPLMGQGGQCPCQHLDSGAERDGWKARVAMSEQLITELVKWLEAVPKGVWNDFFTPKEVRRLNELFKRVKSNG